MLFLTGHSGAGKSTLLKLIHLAERPSRGAVVFGGATCTKVRGGRWRCTGATSAWCSRTIACCSTAACTMNIALPLILRGMRRREIGKRVRDPRAPGPGRARTRAADAAFRWRTAARGHRARGGRRAGAARGRADRQPRSHPVRGNHGAVRLAARTRHQRAVASHDLGLVKRMKKRVLVLDHGQARRRHLAGGPRRCDAGARPSLRPGRVAGPPRLQLRLQPRQRGAPAVGDAAHHRRDGGRAGAAAGPVGRARQHRPLRRRVAAVARDRRVPQARTPASTAQALATACAGAATSPRGGERRTKACANCATAAGSAAIDGRSATTRCRRVGGGAARRRNRARRAGRAAGNRPGAARRAMAQRLDGWLRFGGARGLGAGACLLGLGALLVVGNTVRLDIQSRREESAVTAVARRQRRLRPPPFLIPRAWYGLAAGALRWACSLLAACAARAMSRLAATYGNRSRSQGFHRRCWVRRGPAPTLLGWLGARHLVAGHFLRQTRPTDA